MVLTVIMDLGGVFFSDGTRQAVDKISERYSAQREKVLYALDGDLGSRYRTGELSRDEFWKEAIRHMGIEVPADVLESVWNSCYVVDKRTAEIVDRLNSAGYELFFLSDNVKSRADYLERKYRFQKKFKEGVFSHEAGFRKPDKRIYALLLSKTDSRPQDCVFIDNKKKNLLPAAELGINTILFIDADQLESDLHGLGMDF